MTRTSFLIFLALILAIGGGTVWYLAETREASLARPGTGAALPAAEESLALYSNGPYGFTLTYPETATVEYEFSPSYHIPPLWRVNALPDSVGAPIVAIIPYQTESDHSYPRHYAAMVRIGASADAAEVEACEAPAEDRGEAALPDAEIGGKAWKAFAFQSAGMMQYASGVSYRTVHEGRCIALEKIRVGSSYREEPSAEDIPDVVLDEEYEELSAIVESFTFVR